MSADPRTAVRTLPPDLVERARAVASGALVPTEPRHAATVVLLRDAPDHGVEAFLLERPTTMAFAGGMHVFPGGSVDPRDLDAEVGWTGPSPHDWCAALTADVSLARALVCAAVRETFEECGVLLAGRDDASVVRPADDEPTWSREQALLLDRTAGMSEVLTRHGLLLRADLLRPWAHWVTPEIEPKRFDTRFFVAALPAGQDAAAVLGESESGRWIRPVDALQRHAAGELAMLPPTAFTLAELAEHGSTAEVLATGDAREVRRLLPRIVVTGDDVALLLPGEPGYPDDDELD